jgi:hypothetical protein
VAADSLSHVQVYASKVRRNDGEPPVPARCGWTRSVPTVQEVIDYHGTNGTQWTRSVPAVQEGRFYHGTRGTLWTRSVPAVQEVIDYHGTKRYTVDALRTSGTGRAILPRYQRYTVDTLRTSGTGGD